MAVVSPLSLLCLLCLLLAQASAKYLNSYAGPYTSYVLAFPPCEAEATDGLTPATMTLLSHFKPARPWEGQLFEANITWRKPFNDALWSRVTVASRSNNQWKPNAFVFHFPTGACSAVRANMPHLYETLYHISARSREPCVISPGAYRTKPRSRMNISFPNVPIMPYGHWLLRGMVGRLGTALPTLCWQAEAKTVPRL